MLLPILLLYSVAFNVCLWIMWKIVSDERDAWRHEAERLRAQRASPSP